MKHKIYKVIKIPLYFVFFLAYCVLKKQAFVLVFDFYFFFNNVDCLSKILYRFYTIFRVIFHMSYSMG